MMSAKKSIVSFLKKYKCRLICTLIGATGGILTIFTGFLVGIFLEIILKRKNEEILLKQYLSDYDFDVRIEEPETGSILLGAIAISSCNSIKFVANQFECNFDTLSLEKLLPIFQVCEQIKNPNVDLWTERLASKLIKSKRTDLAEKYINILCTTEFAWGERNRGVKPSEYLANLLNKTKANDELSIICSILGISKTSSTEDAKSAFRKLASKYHPDKLGKISEKQKKDSENYFIEVQKAYERFLEIKHGNI